MKIDLSDKMIESMRVRLEDNDNAAGEKMEEEFLVEVREFVKQGGEHCNCATIDCRHHGDCFSCVAVHRGHAMHLPYCFQSIIKERAKSILELAEIKL